MEREREIGRGRTDFWGKWLQGNNLVVARSTAQLSPTPRDSPPLKRILNNSATAFKG